MILSGFFLQVFLCLKLAKNDILCLKLDENDILCIKLDENDFKCVSFTTVFMLKIG